MLVLAIVGILAMVALPSYQRYVMKSRRADAINALSAVAQAQERWRSNNSSYASSLATLGLDNVSPGRHYMLRIAAVGNPPGFVAGYEVHAEPSSTGLQGGDGECADMFIRVSGGNIAYRDTNRASTASSAACWPQ